MGLHPVGVVAPNFFPCLSLCSRTMGPACLSRCHRRAGKQSIGFSACRGERPFSVYGNVWTSYDLAKLCWVSGAGKIVFGGWTRCGFVYSILWHELDD